MYNSANRSPRAPRQDRNYSNDASNTEHLTLMYTENESKKANVPFDYVATAVHFILQSAHRGEAMLAVYQQHASAWFRGHPMTGSRITCEQCNNLQDELLGHLRAIHAKSRPIAVPVSSGRGSYGQ